MPLLQLQEVDSSKAPDRPVSSGLMPVSVDAVCIPSPYTDGSHEYGHAPLTFYSPSLLNYPRAPVPDSPSSYWPSPQGHASLPSLPLPCPPPLPCSEPWLEAKGPSIHANRWVQLSQTCWIKCRHHKRARTQLLCTLAAVRHCFRFLSALTLASSGG